MGFGTLARALRTGLVAGEVAFLLLLGGIPGFSQDLQPSARDQSLGVASNGEPLDLPLKDHGEVESSDCKGRYRNPLNLLFLMPGLLFFISALVTRRHRRLSLFFSLLFLLGANGPDSSELLRRAEESFASGHLVQARETYLQAEKLLPCNSALLYNLGVVSHYLGQPGYTVHYLRRSLRLAPADGQARSALQALERHYNLVGQVAAPFPVHPDVAYLFLLIFANMVFIMGAFAVRTKKVRFLISLVLVAIVALGWLAFFLVRISLESRSVGVVVSEGGELFRVPEADSKSWFELPEGTSLFVTGGRQEYYLVETPSQIKGWVRRDTILID
jgi:tetratricopeptide (TPR) repeat protein